MQQATPAPRIQAVIFDVDGTLVDSVDLHARAFQDTLQEFGHQIPLLDIRGQIGKGLDNLLPALLPEAEVRRHGQDIGNRKSAVFMERYLPQVRAFPEVRRLFARLVEAGHRLALASSAGREEFHALAGIAGIRDLVEVEVFADAAPRSKPYPDLMEETLRRLGGPPRDAVVCVGDTPYDVTAARKAGLSCIAVLSGGFPASSLTGAVALYPDPPALLAAYADSPLADAWWQPAARR